MNDIASDGRHCKIWFDGGCYCSEDHPVFQNHGKGCIGVRGTRSRNWLMIWLCGYHLSCTLLTPTDESYRMHRFLYYVFSQQNLSRTWRLAAMFCDRRDSETGMSKSDFGAMILPNS